ncbi:MAG: TraB/GumN family protein, partial [Caldimonas sp.]
MRALRVVLLALLGFVSGAQAQAPADCPPVAQPLTPEQVQTGMSAARDRGFLWRITKAGHSSYLYGTIHAAKLEWMFPGPTVADALRRSDTIALELDMLDPGIQQRLAAALVAPRGFALPAALIARLRHWMDAECIAPETLDKMAPELQIASLTVLAARRDGLDPAYGADLMLAGFGHGAHKPV